MRIVFFGTPQFARTILEYLWKQDCKIVAVVTRPDKPSGRAAQVIFSPVKNFAIEHELPLYQPNKASAPDFVEFLRGLEADFFVVAAYAEILKESVLSIPHIACINVHGSLLPKYRGAAPVQRALIAGETESGVTIMKMAVELDAGNILAIRKTPISLEMNAGELMEVLAHLGKEALWQTLQDLEQGTISSIPQDPSLASYAKKLTPQEGQIDWNEDASAIHNKIRGFTPSPGAWCWVEVNGQRKRLLIKKAIPYSLEGPIGVILLVTKSELVVGCLKKSLSLLEVQLEGKKTMPIAEFLRGISSNRLKF